MSGEHPEAPVLGLDYARVGELLARLPAVAAMMRHTSIQSTLGYICGDPEEPEMTFVRDILTLPNREVVDKWYGGRLNASGLAAALTASAVTPTAP